MAKTSDILRLVLVISALSACGKTKGIRSDAGKTAGATQQQGELNADGKGPQIGDALGKDPKLLAATFDINVATLGMPVCKGDVAMQINANFGKEDSAELFEIPRGLIKCTLVGEIDLAQVLGGFAKSEEEKVDDPVVVANDVIHLRQIGLGVFSPPRPMMPSFLAASKEELRKLDYTRTVSVKTSDGKTAKGSVQVRTISFGDSYTPPKMTRKFDNVLHFEVINKGFDGVDKVTSLLFDRMEFRISLKPVAILQVGFKGKIADMVAAAKSLGPAEPSTMPSTGTGGTGTSPSLFGMILKGLVKVIDVNMTMDLVKQAGLDRVEEEGDGEEIGGEKVGD